MPSRDREMNSLKSLLAFACMCSSLSAFASTEPAKHEFATRVWAESQRHTFDDTSYRLAAAGLSGGYLVAPGVMVEGSFGTGVSDDTEAGRTLELNRALSLSLRMTAPPSPSGYRLMSRLGLSVVTLQQLDDVDTKEDFSGGHFSLGVERSIRPGLAWTLEAVYTALDGDIDSGALRASLGWVLRR